MIDWDKINQALIPLKGYPDLMRRFQEAFAYPFVQQAFNLSMPALAEYTRLGVGGDPRHRYDEYAARLLGIIARLEQAGIQDIQQLVEAVQSPERFERFTDQSGIPAADTAMLLKYLVYWVTPMKKPLSGLVKNNPKLSDALKTLVSLKVATNLEVLQRGWNPAGRQELAKASGLPDSTILKIVHMADFSRLPWTSKATIANITGAGYASLAALAGADPQKLAADFLRYGESIGKNLKIGNEIENSQRIARIAPRLVE